MSEKIVTVQEPGGCNHAWNPGTLLARCGVSVLGFHATHRAWPPAGEPACPTCLDAGGGHRLHRTHIGSDAPGPAPVPA